MGFYISAKTGGYYEGDRADRRDPSVPQRENADHQWQWTNPDGPYAEMQDGELVGLGEWVYVDPMTDPDYARRVEAEQEMEASPLTGITYAQAEAYIDANVTDAGTAKAMKKMARLLLAMAKRMDWSE